MRTTALITILILTLAGCDTVGSAIRQYHQTAGQIKLGDNKEEVLRILTPTQKKLPFDTMKSADIYIEKGDLMEIHYFRSSRQPDNLITDDEFTPYIFKNGELIAIGWKTLGGPKSFGKVLPPAPVTSIRHNVTIENK